MAKGGGQSFLCFQIPAGNRYAKSPLGDQRAAGLVVAGAESSDSGGAGTHRSATSVPLDWLSLARMN
jgi:hypothetical protein